MTKLQIKITCIIAVLLVAAYFVFPTIQWYTFTPQVRIEKEKARDKILNKIVNLGLDLKGGSHLVLELDETKLEKDKDLTDAINRAIEILKNRVDQFGVTEPLVVRQGDKWIVVQLPGVDDPERAKQIIGKTALLEFRLVDTSEKMTQIVDKMRSLNIRFNEAKENPGILSLVPTGYVLMPGRNEDAFFIVESTPSLTGAYLVNAKVELGGEFGLPTVGLEFNKDGAKIFSHVTETNINRNLAIVLDDVVQSAPVIRTRIPDGRAQIEGNFTIEDAKFYATILRAGSLPAPVKIIEERTVGPSLGNDSIRSGSIAAVCGFILVILFMVFYYRVVSGLIADAALVFNVVLLFGALALLRFTLTLPGIAGIILTLGMGVDANVLILERIREELEAGKTSRVAVDLGYSRALTAIIDSNITTLIAAIFLFQFGTGPVKGFAVTLTIGIIGSMFTAIFVTKTIYEYLFHKKILEKVSL